MLFRGQCHCGAIRVELATDRQPGDQVLGACQRSFCRKHNARAFSDPKAHVTLTASEPQHLQRYSFGLKTSDQIICRRCGVYVAMTLVSAYDGRVLWHVRGNLDLDAEDPNDVRHMVESLLAGIPPRQSAPVPTGAPATAAAAPR